ncbi:MAG: alpha/beta fold hydrolase [Cyanobacteriota bacterium]|nr:alpha/beta fold hydrolase [Cyanobacteriota bacterium]
MSAPLRCSRIRSLGAGLLAASGLLVAPHPARALDTVKLDLPIVQTAFTVRLAELRSAEALLKGHSDLAELDRALGGNFANRLVEVFATPLPVPLINNLAGTPLATQVRLVLSSFTTIDGAPSRRIETQVLLDAINRLGPKGKPSILDLLQALPGRTAEIDLAQAGLFVKRLANQQRGAEQLLAQAPPSATTAGASTQPGAADVGRSELTLAVSHRSGPLPLVVLQPKAAANGRLVVISHGLWDSPENFEGWGRHLASHGYTVLLPRHPGSDSSQQEAMLSGEVPPPSPEELRLRPLDIKAALDAVAAGQLVGLGSVRADRVVVLGHSWGATTALQLGGAIVESDKLRQSCASITSPDRNLSWVLQCSFLSSADRSSVADARVVAIAAVSPPLSLLFDRQSSVRMQARALLVSGSRDWVVPPDPEALGPFGRSGAASYGHRLVLASGGDHFNLRAPAAGDGTPLRGLLLTWVNGAFAAGAKVKPGPDAAELLPPAGWGDATIPLINVSTQTAVR